jgi:carbon monoxide dehydrogenase subunit G
MPTYESTQTIEIEAPPGACFGVLTDYDRMAEWNGPIKEVRTVGTADDGATEVEYTIDAKLRTVHYVLAHTWTEPSFVGSRYVRGDFKNFAGDYHLEPSDHGTHVTFHLRIDPGLRVPGPVAKMLNEAVMGKALRDLKRRVEELSSNGA